MACLWNKQEVFAKNSTITEIQRRFLVVLSTNLKVLADDIFGDDPNTVYVRMNVSSENKKGFDMNVKDKVESLTELEKKVYDGMVKAVFSSDNQFDIKEAQEYSGISGTRFSGIVGSLYNKGLYNYVGFDGYDGISNHPTKIIYDDISPNGFKIRTDIGKVITDEDDQ